MSSSSLSAHRGPSVGNRIIDGRRLTSKRAGALGQVASPNGGLSSTPAVQVRLLSQYSADVLRRIAGSESGIVRRKHVVVLAPERRVQLVSRAFKRPRCPVSGSPPPEVICALSPGCWELA
jgi:hypothetical protein